MALFKTVSELTDVVSHCAYCPDDFSIMLVQEATSNQYWIPSIKVPPGICWNNESQKETLEIFGVSSPIKRLIRLYKNWIPNHTVTSLYHCVYEVTATMDMKRKSKTTYGKYRNRVRWVSEQEIIKLLVSDSLKSPELLEFFAFCKSSVKKKEDFPPASELIYTGCLVEITEKIILQNKATSIYEQVIESAGLRKEDQITLYKEFLLMCFPAIYMSLPVFQKFISELGWTKEESIHTFRAADLNNRCGLSIRDFLYFIAAVEPSTTHGGGPAELRCRYIFRFFDRDGDNLLNYNEFKLLITSVRKSKKQSLDHTSIVQDSEACYKAMGVSTEKALTVSDFLHAVGDLKFRGTSQIFRSTTSVHEYIRHLHDRDIRTIKSTPPIIQAPRPVAAMIKGTIPLIPPRFPTYEIAVHTVRLQKSATMINVDQIWNLNAAVTVSSTAQTTLHDAHKESIDQFSQKTVANEVLKCLRYLTQINKNKQVTARGPPKRDQFSWGQLDSEQYGRNLISVCHQVKELMKNEPRLLELSSPIYILGDLHGNFPDLLYFERVLWHLGPGLCPCSIMFLGDFVDRGVYSMEVISYLFSYKVQGSTKLKLLRGNHEIREIQKMFTFFSECIMKFGDRLGADVWNAINDAFDVMPLAAVIDSKVFCCHGGIPPPWLCPVISVINSIPVPLNQPDEQSSLAWELMWNDPVRQKQISEGVKMELMANEGFAVNTRRGTAHMFSIEALEKFLNVNNLSHIIRAHEVAQAGFYIQQKAKLLTVFSSSKYCGGQNEAACVLADQGKLRVLRLETS